MPRLKRFTVVGLFEIDMYEYDSGIALIHIDDAARLLGSKGEISGLRLKLDDVEQARKVRHDLSESLNQQYSVRDWTQEYANFFGRLKLKSGWSLSYFC